MKNLFRQSNTTLSGLERPKIKLFSARFLGAILLCLVILTGCGPRPLTPATAHGVVYETPQTIPNFKLTSENGPVESQTWRGKVVVISFGYTFCPDVCPTILASFKRTIKALGDQASQVQFVFISVDPQRDTPARLGQYTHFFHPSILGLTGLPAEIDQAAALFGVKYTIEPPDPKNGEYSVSHTAMIFVLNQEGKLRLGWPYDVDVEGMKADLQALLTEKIQ